MRDKDAIVNRMRVMQFAEGGEAMNTDTSSQRKLVLFWLLLGAAFILPIAILGALQ